MIFPQLKTGAVAQYPLRRAQQFSTEAVRFLDGSQQKFRLFGSGMRRWVISLEALDEQELCSLIDFVDAQASGVFAFTDPITGEVVARCALATGHFDAEMTDEARGRTTILVEEIG